MNAAAMVYVGVDLACRDVEEEKQDEEEHYKASSRSRSGGGTMANN